MSSAVITTIKFSAVTGLAIILALVVAVLAHTAILTMSTPITLIEIKQDYLARTSEKSPVDTLPVQFKQSKQGASGLAAMAYLLSRFGGSVHEKDFFVSYGDWSRLTQPRYLIQLAQRENYLFEQQALAYEQLPTAAMQPIIAVMNNAFYVVVHSIDESVILFDPRVGRIVSVSSKDFISQWSGQTLRLVMRSNMGAL